MHCRVREHLGELSRRFGGRSVGDQIARDFGDFLFDQRAQVFDHRSFERRVGSRLKHARDRAGHMPQRDELGAEPADGDFRPLVGGGRQRSDELDEERERGKEALRAAALKGELACHLFPTIAFLAKNGIVGNKRILKDDFVEMTLAGEIEDRPDRGPRPGKIDEKLAQARVAAVRIDRARAAEQDHVVAMVSVGGPELRAVDAPALIRAPRAGTDRRQVGPGVGLAHANAEEALARGDPRQDR